MTPDEFYQRIDQEREEMSLAEFLVEFEDITPKMIGQFRGYRTKRLLPSVRTLIALEDLFTAEEMREILTAKMSRGRLRLTAQMMAKEYLEKLTEQKTGRSPQREVSRKFWLEKARMEKI